MKRTLLFGILIGIYLFTFSGCKKDSSNPSIPITSFSGKSIDYFSVNAGKTLNIKVSGTQAFYDSLGNLTGSKSLNNSSYSTFLGNSVLINNMSAYPICYLDDHNNSRTSSYLAVLNGALVGFDQYGTPQYLTLLPADIKVGDEWNLLLTNQINKKIKVKLIESLSNFTNTTGKAYQNVLNFHITYQDSSSGGYYYSTGYYSWKQTVALDMNLYLAKGTGIVGGILNNLESIDKENYNSSTQNIGYYLKEKDSGTAGSVD